MPKVAASNASNSKMLLLTAIVQHVRAQRSPQDTPKCTPENKNVESLRAPALARTLTENPKLMIELAVELTKLALNEIPQQPEATGAAS